MTDTEHMRLGLRLLDEQIVDAEGRRCGRVEDVEFDAGVGESARVIGVLGGATAWKRRLPPRIAQLIPDDPPGLCRIPVEEIAKIENEIELSRAQADLELASAGDGARLAVSELIGTLVVDPAGRRLGRVRDVMAVRRRDSDERWRLDGLLVGRRALLQRVGFSPRSTTTCARGGSRAT